MRTEIDARSAEGRRSDALDCARARFSIDQDLAHTMRRGSHGAGVTDRSRTSQKDALDEMMPDVMWSWLRMMDVPTTHGG